MSRSSVAVLAVGDELLGGYTMESIAWTRTWWYFAALLPFWSLAMGTWIAELRPPWLSAMLGTFVLAACGVGFFVSNWGSPGGLRPLAAALGAQIDSPTCSHKRAGVFCSSAPEVEAWPTAEIIASIVV